MQIKDIVAGKKYTNKSGEEKIRWITVGSLFIKDDGKMTVKLNEYINPIAFQNERGEVWLNVFEHKEKTDNAPTAQQVPQRGASVSVVRDAQAYAEKWRKQAAQQKALDEAPDESYFEGDGCVVDGVDFNA